MRLEHLNLIVRDIEASLRFYRTAFPHWKVRGGGLAVGRGGSQHWIHFGDERCYFALYDGGAGENRDLDGDQVGLVHFAFETVNLDGVVQRLAEAGFEPISAGAQGSFRRNIYFLDPDNYEIEFVEYFSDDPSQRNRYSQTEEFLSDLADPTHARNLSRLRSHYF